MKKNALILVVAMVCCMVAVRAQAPMRTLPGNYLATPLTRISIEDSGKYSSPADWGSCGDWYYFCGWDSITQSGLQNNGNFIIGNQMDTDHPIKIVGIAACAYMQGVGDTTIEFFMPHWSTNAGEQMPGYFFPNVRDTSVVNRITDSMILYKPDGNNLVKLRAAPWRMEQPHDNIVLPPELNHDFYPSRYDFIYYDTPGHPHYFDTAPVSALYEAYFDEPIVVEDSFVVAGTAFNNDGSYGMEAPPIWTGRPERMWLWDHRATRYWSIVTSDLLSDCRRYFDTVMCWRKYRNNPWARVCLRRYPEALLNIVKNCRQWRVAIYPIIDLDFDTTIEHEHCQRVTSVAVVESTDSTATLMWDAVNSVRWEVKYGMVGMDEENYRVLPSSVPTITLRGLVAGVQYKVYVRGWCPCDSSWGAWSEPKNFSLRHGGDEQGIAEVCDLDRYTHLMPNPAHGVVSVVSSLRLERVAVYDLSGRCVVEQEASGISEVVDISSLAPGTYIAALHTSYGIATKKLVVQ